MSVMNDMDDKRQEAGTKLLAAAKEFWEACHAEGQYGAVQWLEGTGGELLIYTRGEYRQQLMAGIHGLPSATVHFFRGEVMPPWRFQAERLRVDTD